jgi:hypothetical protein
MGTVETIVSALHRTAAHLSREAAKPCRITSAMTV